MGKKHASQYANFGWLRNFRIVYRNYNTYLRYMHKILFYKYRCRYKYID